MTTPLQKLAESMILEASLGFTEKKLKFLIYSCQQFFGVKVVSITFDATKKVPQIILTPEKLDGSFFDKEEWQVWDQKWNFEKTGIGMRSFLRVDEKVKIMFKRTLPKVKK
jgi:translation elongation factor P/translation initiation factor 5A